MIKIFSRIDKFPSDLNESYSLIAYTDGLLSIEVDGNKFFEETDILIIEFFFSLHKWICEYEPSNPSNFYYASMDFEEEPILAFNYNKASKLYELESVWKKMDVSSTFEDINYSYKSLMIDLRTELLEKYNYFLELK